ETWISTERVGDEEVPVNRTDAFAFLGGAQNTNEECYIFQKAARLLGTAFVEHQARLRHSPTVPGLGATFGRGAMTNHWVDLQNCKAILVEGSNVAENHPMAFKWIRKAQENGAKLIHVDPRFTRTSAGADVYARIRPGTDAALQNTMINHLIVNNLFDEDYVVTHTNALFLGDEAFDFKDGLFSGYDAEKHAYDTKTWGYQLDGTGKPRVAKSLDDPHCVFARLKTFVSRYTLEVGEHITGIPADQIRQIAETMAKNRPGSILYALGMTQHTTGVQGIRSFTILQLLLGNIGKPGGGVNALRGEPNVQGACDMAV